MINVQIFIQVLTQAEGFVFLEVKFESGSCQVLTHSFSSICVKFTEPKSSVRWLSLISCDGRLELR